MAGLYREYERVATHGPIAARAKANPGQWVEVGLYRVAETARSMAARIRFAHQPAYAPAGSFQTYRSLGDGQRRLWVRYVHGITPPATLPEEMPEAARLVLLGFAELGRPNARADWAADFLDEHGYAEDAELVRRWLAGLRGPGGVTPRTAAAYLLRRSTREDIAQ
ncbi:hypothetical protein ACIQTN_29910 [Streptomyces werraensis]|uniref:hypothetical protein n=1 Tax=Streptomyces werraensis TaxID=68284 RepID=UPI003821200F